MATTSLIRTWWAPWRCNTDKAVLSDVRPFGRNVGRVAKPADAALRALAYTLEASYGTPSSFWVERLCPQGISGRPCQPDGTDCSLHNYHVAVDIDPPDNPHLHRRIRKTDLWPHIKLTRSQVAAIEGIRNVQGEQMWRWLGWAIGDTMHFQINVPPEVRSSVDWSSVPPLTGITVARLCKDVGLTAAQATIAVAIAKAESGWNPSAVGDAALTDATWGPSVGLWQIRSVLTDRGTGRPRDRTRLSDPAFNAYAMEAISNGGTYWRPWSVWLHGTYRRWLPDAQTAVDVVYQGTSTVDDNGLDEGIVLKRGDSGRAVATVQAALVDDDYDLGEWPPFADGFPPGADGKFGGDTESAIKDFQSVQGLPETGQADGTTVAVLLADDSTAVQSGGPGPQKFTGVVTGTVSPV